MASRAHTPTDRAAFRSLSFGPARAGTGALASGAGRLLFGALLAVAVFVATTGFAGRAPATDQGDLSPGVDSQDALGASTRQLGWDNDESGLVSALELLLEAEESEEDPRDPAPCRVASITGRGCPPSVCARRWRGIAESCAGRRFGSSVLPRGPPFRRR